MAYVNDQGGGHTGPYWRRQTGTTQPGERSSAQLRMVNLARQRLGLPPVGGQEGDNTRSILPSQGGPGQQMLPGAIDQQRSAYEQQAQQQRGAFPQAPGGQQDPQEAIGPPGTGFEGQLPNPQQGGIEAQQGGHADLRAQLLAQFQGAIQPNYSRDALRQYVQQHLQRRAIPGGPAQKPILPQRQARKAIPY